MGHGTDASGTLSRRAFLRAAGVVGLGAAGARADCPAGFGSLLGPDENGLQLPVGFSSRVVATTGETVGATSHVWHGSPDGGATFPAPGGGWIYVSNAERGGTNGGVGAIAFGADGGIADAYSILTGTAGNCAGGPTPWGTWLSCEEVTAGEVYECDPYTPGSQGVARPALGWFRHEAAAVDPLHHAVYLTEDLPDGLLYRFTPTSWPALASGGLEVVEVLDPGGDGPIAPGQTRPVAWHPLPEPNPGSGETATRYQVPAASAFDGGEGAWYQAGIVTFTTKGDNRVWQLDTNTQTLSILYDFATSSNPVLRGVDNVTVSACGDVYVAEDNGNLEIVALGADGSVAPFLRLTGVTGTEITGPAFTPDARRLYFSSQRNPGVTYEVSGPFESLAVPSLGGWWGAAALGALATAAWWRQRPRPLAFA